MAASARIEKKGQQSMQKELENYRFYHYFKEISAVPRGSGDNKRISDYLVNFAKEHDLWYYQDETYNVVIRKEASKGWEHLPGIILQGHMDMVCEKEAGVAHDFTKEGLELCIEGDYLFAKGTTLGGDDGIALAYGLAILEDTAQEYPMIELLATTDEETGMYGAKALDTNKLRGKYVINLDTEEEGTILAGCAGGLTSGITMPLEREEKTGAVYEVILSGLQGGHSGCEIHKNRTNAVLLLAKLLYEKGMENCRIIEMEGGNKDNAIPREAKAVVLIEGDSDTAEEQMKQYIQKYQQILYGFEPGLTYHMERRKESKQSVLTKQTQKKVLFLLNTAPSQVQTYSAEIPGLVETSLNMGIFSLKDAMEASYSIRSSQTGEKEYVSAKLRDYAEILGGTYCEKDAYPAWVFRKDSGLREIMVSLYEEMYGKKPTVDVIHAGLECGILSEKSPQWDIVAIGPNIYDIHTPKERMEISSAIRVYEYLQKVLETKQLI